MQSQAPNADPETAPPDGSETTPFDLADPADPATDADAHIKGATTRARTDAAFQILGLDGYAVACRTVLSWDVSRRKKAAVLDALSQRLMDQDADGLLVSGWLAAACRPDVDQLQAVAQRFLYGGHVGSASAMFGAISRLARELSGSEAAEETLGPTHIGPELQPPERAFARIILSKAPRLQRAREIEDVVKNASSPLRQARLIAGWLAFEARPTAARASRVAKALFRAGEVSSADAILPREDGAVEEIVVSIRSSAHLMRTGFALPPPGHLPIPGHGVAYVVGSAPPYHLSGYTVRTHELLKAAIAAGHHVTCFARPGFPWDRPRLTRLHGFVPEEIPTRDHEVVIDDVRYVFTYLAWSDDNAAEFHREVEQRLVERFCDERPAIVQATSDYNNALPAFRAARRVGAPFIYEMRGLRELTMAARQGDEDSERFRLSRAFEVAVAQDADQLLCITRGVAEEMAAGGVDRRKIKLLPNAVNPEAFADVNAAQVRRRLGIPAETFVIVYAGSLTFYEGLDDVITATSLLRDRSLDAKLLIVGDGTYRRTLEAHVRSLNADGFVTFLGRVEPSRVSQYLAIADVVPIVRKAFSVCKIVSPLKPFEAMALGRPVVVSELAALTEIVQDSVTGFVCPPSDPPALARLLERLARTIGLGEMAGRRARRWVAAERTWEENIKVLHTIWSELDAASGTKERTSPYPRVGAAFDASCDNEPGLGRRELGRTLTEVAKEIRKKDPIRAIELGERALRLDPRLFRLKWLVAVMYAAGMLRRPEQLISSAEQAYGSEALAGWPRAAAIRSALRVAEDPELIPPRLPRPPSRSDKVALYLAASSLPHHISGYTTRTHNVIRAISDAGWQVVAATRPGYPWDRSDALAVMDDVMTYPVDEVPYHHLAGLPSNNAPLSDYLQSASEEILAFARSRNVAIIHAASNYVNALPALMAARKLGVPFVYEVRGLLEPGEVPKSPKAPASDRLNLIRDLETRVAREADVVLVLTEGLRSELAKRGVAPEAMSLVPDCVDVQKFSGFERDRELEEALGLHGCCVIGFIGSVVDYEGLDDLVGAAAALAAEGRPLALLVVGDGDGMAQVREAASRFPDLRFVAPGRMPPDQVPSYCSLVDIAAFPQRPAPATEIVAPLKPLEAMAMSKAVVASNVAAIAEMVRHEETGLLFQKGDASALRSALARAVDDPELRQRLGRAGRAFVERERSWTVAGGLIGSLYDRLTSSQPPAHAPAPGAPLEARL